MHPLLRRCLLFGSIAIVSLLALPAGAVYADQGDGHTVVVQPKQSIQAAIDNAPPGSTILVERGTYYENLSITKNHITLKTKREPGSVVLQWREGPSSNACGKPVSGICVTGQVNNGSPVVTRPVAGTRIDGFVVDAFPGSGVWLFNAVDSAVTQTEARYNKDYGVAGFVQSRIRYADNVAHHNGGPGLYIGDSPNANAYVVGNRSFNNGVGGPEGFGFLFRDSTEGVVRDNSATGNCVGFMFADTRFNVDVPLKDWRVVENSARHNNGTCTGEAPFLPVTAGIGFLLLGTQHVTLEENIARGNGTRAADGAESGGIVVRSGGPFGGADPTDNRIAENTAFGNAPFDIFFDKSGSGNKFEDNRCHLSKPPGLCQGVRDD
jgi:hypothetical protein